MTRHLITTWNRYRTELSTLGLAALMLATPLDDKFPHISGLMAICELVLLFFYVNATAETRGFLRVALPVAGVWVIARLIEAFGTGRLSHVSPIAGFLLSCTILWALMGRFRSISYVTHGVIAEAIITYLVIAIAFSQLYWILSHFIPNAFDLRIPRAQSAEFLYFSMITLSGLGYSSIFPMNPVVRLIAAFENVIGLFYIAVVVSRFVSSYNMKVQRRAEQRSHGAEQHSHVQALVPHSSVATNGSSVQFQVTPQQVEIYIAGQGRRLIYDLEQGTVKDSL